MNKEDIITLPHPSLRTKSKRVGLITDEVRHIVDGMQEATLDWEASRAHEVGVALAAVQVNQLFKIVVVRNNYDDKNNHDFTVFINPEVVKYEGEVVEDYEGCLSIKDVYGKVPRYNRVRVKALNLEGKTFRVTAEGFLARILQHEIDHTNGVVFIDHIKDDPQAFYRLQANGEIASIDYVTEVEHNQDLWD